VLVLREAPAMPSWLVEAQERIQRGLTPVDLVLVHMMTIGHRDFVNMEYWKFDG
jgi:hypothetical protein